MRRMVAMLVGIGENSGLGEKPCENQWYDVMEEHYARAIGLLAMQARTKMRGGTVFGLAGGTAGC